ncbi:hypothetical protein MASR2M47_43770 [Draconibacterium sp.]|jgi:hypothetical protein
MENSLRLSKRLFLVFYISILLISGCVSDYDGKILGSAPVPVLNGILYADSVLALNLTWSNHPQEKEFEPIPGALFILKKNGLLISTNHRFNNDGTYFFNDTCLNGDKYEVEVQISGHPKLTSQTTIPHKPAISVTKAEQKENERTNKVFNLDVTNISKEINALYVFLFLNELDANSNWEQRGIYCDSPFADPFNRVFDSWAPEGFTYEYESFVRFPIENLANGSLHTRLAFLGGSEIIRFYVIAATKEHDLYYKGGYLQRSFNPEVNLPFTYQPIFLPTNISGGAGIFAGIDLSLFDFKGEM